MSKRKTELILKISHLLISGFLSAQLLSFSKLASGQVTPNSNHESLDLICADFLHKCLPLDQYLVSRLDNQPRELSRNKSHIYFNKVLNLERVKTASIDLKLSSKAQRRLIQIAANNLNQRSISEYVEENLKSSTVSVIIYPLAINNSAVIEFTDNVSNNPVNIVQLAKTKLSKNVKNKKVSSKLTVALIDSGVSRNHESLQQTIVEQYNPQTNSLGLSDSGLGHGTGILSLMAATKVPEKIKGGISEAQFLSCKGLPNGQYQFIDILQCMNWLFFQEEVHIIINAWLASSPGCKNEWLYPLKVLWFANTIPIFAVGNYGDSKERSYSPANLSPFGNEIPLISVGALGKDNKRLPSSSYGFSHCAQTKTLANIMASAQDLKVAVPFQLTSYQTVRGSSYAVALVGVALAKLKLAFPQVDNKIIVTTLLKASHDLGDPGIDNEYGYGMLNLEKALTLLAVKND